MFALADVPLIIITLIVFIWLGAITFLLVRVLRTFTQLTKGVSDKDLKSILDETISCIKKNEVANAGLEKKLEKVRVDGIDHVQKVGLIRYNPFADTGGNQSFVLALLDGKNNGFVITSLHSREATRVFAKPVVAGKETDFEFSKEEAMAITEAQKEQK